MYDKTLEHYDKHAESFSAQYRAAEPEALHKILMRWLPSSGSVLEVGCGSGRDAIFMAGLGLDVIVNREPGEVRLIFERLGFVDLAQEDTEDSLKRGIRWTTLVFGCDHATGSRPVDQIEAVINHDKEKF